ncbi:MAG: hypothetical protein HDT20_08055 [Oscillibacter sp.]|nr:hypothetical protein [Oscillibacter sp.]
MLNKKLLRQYADPGLTIPPGHGLLHAEQVSYIVRTAVKIIDHHRTLILYVYDREQVLKGISGPIWTVFQTSSDFITLAHDDGGRIKWRTARFVNLGSNYLFVDKCAFYSQSDESRVQKYFHSKFSGFSPLVHAQSDILAARLRKGQRRRDKKILARMRSIRPLPRSLESWVRRSIMPAYFFYDYKRNQKTVAGTCSACGKAITLSGVKHNGKAVCPHCNRTLITKSRGRRGRILDRYTCQMVQRVSGNELVIRIIKAMYRYDTDQPREIIYENARIFVSWNENDTVSCDCYYYTFGDYDLTPWKRGERPEPYPYQYYYEGDSFGYVYPGTLSGLLLGTPWQYCPVGLFFEHYHEPMEFVSFLMAYLKHPRFEHLIKVGFFNLAADVANSSYSTKALDETQNRTHRILKVAPEDVDFLREVGADLSDLRVFQEYVRENLKGRQELLRWSIENQITRDVDKILRNLSVHKFLRYMEQQYSFLKFRRTQNGTVRYKDMQALVSEYRDYLDMCGRERYDLRNDFILFPKDLQKSHDAVAGRIKHKADAKTRRKFKAAYKRIAGILDYECDGMKIICPVTPDDVIAEGQTLHHCVGSYIHRIANGECLVLFVRRCEDISKPFYTIELKNQEVVQLRGKSNGEATPEVQKFVDRWTREVLQAQKAAA